MHKLSARFDVWKQKQDLTTIELPFLVVGSGYGGSVAARRLAENNRDVTVLEKGSEYVPGDFPNDFSTAPTYIRGPSATGAQPVGSASGHIELKAGPGVISVVGNGLGGGSLINAGVLIEPSRGALSDEHWPDEFRNNVDELAPYFTLSKDELGGHLWNKPCTKSLALNNYAKQFSSEEQNTFADNVIATIDPDQCTMCGDCASGCNVEGAKLTLRDTYLKKAKETKTPARILTGATVYSVYPLENCNETKWRVRVVPTEAAARYRSLQEAAELEPAGVGVDIITDTLILAAGTFGTVEILQRSKSLFGSNLPLSNALGSRFSTNGDALSFSVDEPNNVDGIGVGAAETWRTAAGTEKVGPTITKSVDLRAGRPLNEQYLIQDASIPGAIAPVFDMMLSITFEMNQIAKSDWRYPKDGEVEQFTFGDLSKSLESNDDPSNSLARRTQTLLTMGHDGAKGRIVWVAEMDGSVPYWDDPEKVDLYSFQAKEMQKASEAVGGMWSPSLLWQPIPPAMSNIMSGPLPDKMLTTVHPLGGCTMGSDPKSSVVDHYGRAWRVNNLYPSKKDKYESLYILDGSIMPTSLGCNPLLTITAIAERTLDQSPLASREFKSSELCNSPFPCSTYRAEPFHRPNRSKMPAYLEERLVAIDFSAPNSFRQKFGDLKIDTAELQLDLPTDDWNEMWADKMHPLKVSGTLRLGSGSNWVEYHATKESCAYLFYAGIQPRGFRGSIIWGLGNWLGMMRVALTWWSLRPRERANVWGGDRDTKFDWKAMIAYAKHATEIRKMRYDVTFQKSGTNALGPEKLHLKGSKHIEYPATWWQLVRYFLRNRSKQDPSQDLILRESFIEQASHLNVKLGTGSWFEFKAKNRFKMDFTYMVERLPVRLSGGADLPTALVDLMRYPMVFTQYLLKTRIFDFRLPDYSGRNTVDSLADESDAPERNRWLRSRSTQGYVKPVIYTLKVPQGHSSFDLPDRDPIELELKLLRYRRPEGESVSGRLEQGDWYKQPVLKVKSILLTHAFAQSGYSYTFQTTDQNMAEHFYQQGYEVWIVEHRISTSVPAHQYQSTVDQIGKYDIPSAVDKMISEINLDLDANELNPEALPVQCYSFAQCIGGAASAMALLSGRISYQDRYHQLTDGNVVCLPKLAGLVISQTHPHCVGQPMTQAKTWIPSMLRDTIGLSHLPLAVRGPQDSLINALFDRLCNALPVPEEELCPVDLEKDEDHCATCRRIRFLEAPLFLHRNVNVKTHRELPMLFGDANVRLFAHGVKFVDSERLVTEDGNNAYVTDENIQMYGALPVLFLHGRENELFHFEGAERSAKHWHRVHPQWADHASQGMKGTADLQQPAWIVDDYAHVDVLVGDNADKDIYTPLRQAFDYWHQNSATTPASNEKQYVCASLPLSGPFVGAVKRDANGKPQVSISFRIDDRILEGGLASLADFWAFARIRVPGRGKFGGLHKFTLSQSINGFRHASTKLRMASGEISLDESDLTPDLEVECFSVHKVFVGSGAKPPGYAVEASWNLMSTISNPKQVNKICDDLMLKIDSGLKSLRDGKCRPGQLVSVLDQFPAKFENRIASLKVRSLQALAPAESERTKTISFGIGSCRYPGFRFEHRRVDSWIENANDDIDFALLLGDQIYADYTAGFTDELSPEERFIQRHRYAFARNHRGDGKDWFGDWLAKRPVFMTPDDHEFMDGYPDGPQLIPASQALHNQTQIGAHDTAYRALVNYQQRQITNYEIPNVAGAWQFEAGPARFLMLDTRSFRKSALDANSNTILTNGQIKALQNWVGDPAASNYLNVLVTGSVILPGLSDHDSPSNPGRRDNFQSNPIDRDLILKILDERAADKAFRFLLVSGDYHLAAAAEVVKDKKSIGATLVSPPLYQSMPFMNSSPDDLWLDEEPYNGWKLLNGQACSGSGLGNVEIKRSEEQDVLYEIEYTGNLWEPELQDNTFGTNGFKVVIKL